MTKIQINPRLTHLAICYPYHSDNLLIHAVVAFQW